MLPPASFLHEQEKVKKRWPAAVEFIKSRKLNEMSGPKRGKVGIVLQGGMYNGVIRALQRLGLADLYGSSMVPLYILNVTYPLVDEEFVRFAQGKKAILWDYNNTYFTFPLLAANYEFEKGGQPFAEQFDALVALGCVIKGDTYHFEVVCNESAAGITRVGLDLDVAIGNGVLTTYTDEQAESRAEQKGYEAAQAAVEMALLQEWTHSNFGEN